MFTYLLTTKESTAVADLDRGCCIRSLTDTNTELDIVVTTDRLSRFWSVCCIANQLAAPETCNGRLLCRLFCGLQLTAFRFHSCKIYCCKEVATQAVEFVFTQLQTYILQHQNTRFCATADINFAATNQWVLHSCKHTLLQQQITSFCTSADLHFTATNR